MMAEKGAVVHSIDTLCATAIGGAVILTIPKEIEAGVGRSYSDAMRQLDRFEFWREGKTAPYRPARGLWLPQRRAIAFAHAYLFSRQYATPGAINEAALIKMPTGTGKTAVIAALACGSPLLRKTLILTPRAGLVYQMKHDLSHRFWGRALGAAYYDCEIHENLEEDEIDRVRLDVNRGRIAPVRALLSDQYTKIWLEREQRRQILVSRFNGLHLVLGIEPPAHRSMYGRDVREVAQSLRHADGYNVDAFRALLKSVDLVMVDEGHYEPAYSWSQAVRAIGKPTIIFSATPYRNDYKYFQIQGNYVFNLSWQEAVDQRLVRDVQCQPPIAPAEGRRGNRGKRSRVQSGYNEASFVREFATTLEKLPEGKKAIVHAATYQSLKAIQRAFFAQGEAAVLIHDAFAGSERSCPDLNRKQRASLQGLRFHHVRYTEGNKAAQKARIWMHQYKLLEGIDDSRFVEVWLYDGFNSARQVVQQVGRAIRRPDLKDPSGQHATIRGSFKRIDAYDGAPTVGQQTSRRWDDYRDYERYAAEHSRTAFIAETQLVAAVKRAAPAVQYIAGEFRGGHFLDQAATMDAFLLPRRATACRVRDVLEHRKDAIPDSFLDTLQTASMEAMLLEERFDIAAVPPTTGDDFRDVRLIRYLAWSNSPYLARHHIPEWRLGMMAIARAGRYIFILDTEGICIDYDRLDLLSPESQELKRLFAKSPESSKGSTAAQGGTRIVETTASGLDISELGLRSISVRRHALEEGYFDLAEASQVPTMVQGWGQLGDRTARRRLSLSRSSVADATAMLLPVKDYVEWARIISDTMANEVIEPHDYFGRFAREVRALDPDTAVPKSILLDMWDVLDVSDETKEERRWDSKAAEEILSYDTCCDVEERQVVANAPPRYYFSLGPYELEIKYTYRNSVPPSGRYQISSESLNERVANPENEGGDREFDPADRRFGRRLSTSLTRLVNQEQAFRIIPSLSDVVYSHSHFYKPEINEGVLSILEGSDALSNERYPECEGRSRSV
jgi:type III restriction/modification enzyme restriction subunit